MPTPARPRLPGPVAAALAALAGAALLAGCTSPVTGSAAPAGGGGATSVADPGTATTEPAASPRDRADACEVTLSGRGSVQVRGGGTRVATRNGVTSLACDGGAPVVVEIGDGGVAFTPEGGAAVRVDAGATAVVGDYEITVEEVEGDRAEFVVVPPA